MSRRLAGANAFQGVAETLLSWDGMLHLTIQQFMSRSPHTIAHDQPLTAAHKLMRAHDIRHLPVLDGGQLVGLLSQRDLHLIESLEDVDPDQVTVSEAMTTDVFAVAPRASLRKVATEMATRKLGSAVVVDDNAIVGVFTTIDALDVLVSVLQTQGPAL